jgi:hypothetical protein
VPLLRLAQLAPLCREFQAAYNQRHSAHVAATSWLQNASLVPFPTDSGDVLSIESYLRTHPAWGCEARCATRQRKQRLENLTPALKRFILQWAPRNWMDLCLPLPWKGHAKREIHVGRLFVPPSVTLHVATPPPFSSVTAHVASPPGFSSARQSSIRMTGWFKCTLRDSASQAWFDASMEVVCEVVVGRKRRTMSCRDLVLRCNHAPSQEVGLAECLTLCTAMAQPLNTFLHEVVRGAPCDHGRPARVGLVQRVTLVLPPGRTLMLLQLSWPSLGAGLPGPDSRCQGRNSPWVWAKTWALSLS